jgi:hypothetical protein
VSEPPPAAPPPDAPPPPPRPVWENAVAGALLVFALHLLWVLVLMLLGALVDRGASTDVIVPLMLAPLLFIGASQLLYVGPAFWWARRRGFTRLAQGILIGAGITFLLNAACWGLIAVSVG